MSLLYTALPSRASHAAAPRALLTAFATSVALALWHTLHQWRKRQQGRRELARMGERGLRDLGLSRADVFQEVRKPFWQG